MATCQVTEKRGTRTKSCARKLKHVDPEKLKKVINAVVAIKSKLKRKR